MKAIYLSFSIAVLFSLNTFAQNNGMSNERPRVIGDSASANPSVQNSKTTGGAPAKVAPDQFRDVKTGRTLTFRDIKNKLAEAKRELQTKPLATAAVQTAEGTTAEYVRIAFHDWKKGAVDY